MNGISDLPKMNGIIDITDWAINSSGGDEYTPPEYRVAILRGKISSHPTLEVTPDNNEVRTSAITGWIGRNVFTRNSTYRLVGDPGSWFTGWLAEMKFAYDPANPLKVLSDHNYLPDEG